MDVNRPDTSAAYALDAVNDDERDAFEAEINRDGALAEEVAALRSAAGRLAETTSSPPPPALRGRVLDAARRRRSPGRSVESAPHRASPIEAFRGQAADFTAVLGSLPPATWDAMTVTGWTAHELAGHVLGIMRYVGSLFGIDTFDVPAGTEADHLAKTHGTIVDVTAGSPAETVTAIGAALDGLGTIEDTRFNEPVVYDGMPVTIGRLLVIQTFELWTHGDDLLRAAGRPLSRPSAERLDLMSEMAVADMLSAGMTMTERAHPGKTARVVLTGSGGGAWTVPLSFAETPHADPPDLTLMADVVDFCRVVARRMTPQDIHFLADGETRLAEDLLVGLQAFAA